VLQAAQNFYRQQSGLGGSTDYAHKNVQAAFPDGSFAIFDYKYNSGQEYLSVRWSAPAPEGVQQQQPPEVEVPVEPSQRQEDYMIDGYIAVGLGIDAGDPSASLTVLLNGVPLKSGPVIPFTDYHDPTPNIWLFTFGSGALRSHSINNDEQNPNYPKKLFNKIVPKLENKNDKNLPNLFAYPFFGKDGVLYFTQSVDGQPHYNSDGGNLGVSIKNAKIVDQIDFPHISESSLKVADKNIITLKVAATGDTRSISSPSVCAWSEFYSRKKIRPAVVSWRKAGVSIQVNDTPQVDGLHAFGWALGGTDYISDPYFEASTSYDFDLSGKADPLFYWQIG
jgi:hypothetical protein